MTAREVLTERGRKAGIERCLLKLPRAAVIVIHFMKHRPAAPPRRDGAQVAVRAAPLLILLAGCGARSALEGTAPASPGAPESVVLFGGLAPTPDGTGQDLGDTWVWTSAGAWSEVHPPAAPSARYGATAAGLDGDIVLFGGDGMVAETWVWNGTTWAQQHPSFSPPPLTSSVMGPLGQGLVLFSGYDEGVIYYDAWQWDGTNWTHESPGAMPSARDAAAGAVIDGSLVIFGGEDVDFLPLGDTWVYDGASWTQQTPAHAPSPRRAAVAAAYDGKMVMFGGDTLSSSTGGWLSVDETWVWDGTDWTQMEPSASPPARSFAAMAAAAGQVVLFGGGNFGGNGEDPAATWTWDGSTWEEQTGPGPAPRNFPSMASR